MVFQWKNNETLKWKSALHFLKTCTAEPTFSLMLDPLTFSDLLTSKGIWTHINKHRWGFIIIAELITQESDVLHERWPGKLQQGQLCPARESRRSLWWVTAPARLPRVSSGQPCLFAFQLQHWLTSSHSKQLFAHLGEESHFAKVGGTRCHILRLPHRCTLSFLNTKQENKELLTLCGLYCMKASSAATREHHPPHFTAKPQHPPGVLPHLQLSTLSFIFK